MRSGEVRRTRPTVKKKWMGDTIEAAAQLVFQSKPPRDKKFLHVNLPLIRDSMFNVGRPTISALQFSYRTDIF